MSGQSPQRPLVYLLYNKARSLLSITEDTKLSEHLAEHVTQRLQNRGFCVKCTFNIRELCNLEASNSLTNTRLVFIITDGFATGNWPALISLPSFKNILTLCNITCLVIGNVKLPDELDSKEVIRCEGLSEQNTNKWMNKVDSTIRTKYETYDSDTRDNQVKNFLHKQQGEHGDKTKSGSVIICESVQSRSFIGENITYKPCTQRVAEMIPNRISDGYKRKSIDGRFDHLYRPIRRGDRTQDTFLDSDLTFKKHEMPGNKTCDPRIKRDISRNDIWLGSSECTKTIPMTNYGDDLRVEKLATSSIPISQRDSAETKTVQSAETFTYRDRNSSVLIKPRRAFPSPPRRTFPFSRYSTRPIDDKSAISHGNISNSDTIFKPSNSTSENRVHHGSRGERLQIAKDNSENWFRETSESSWMKRNSAKDSGCRIDPDIDAKVRLKRESALRCPCQIPRNKVTCSADNVEKNDHMQNTCTPGQNQTSIPSHANLPHTYSREKHKKLFTHVNHLTNKKGAKEKAEILSQSEGLNSGHFATLPSPISTTCYLSNGTNHPRSSSPLPLFRTPTPDEYYSLNVSSGSYITETVHAIPSHMSSNTDKYVKQSDSSSDEPDLNSSELSQDLLYVHSRLQNHSKSLHEHSRRLRGILHRANKAIESRRSLDNSLNEEINSPFLEESDEESYLNLPSVDKKHCPIFAQQDTNSLNSSAFAKGMHELKRLNLKDKDFDDDNYKSVDCNHVFQPLSHQGLFSYVHNKQGQGTLPADDCKGNVTCLETNAENLGNQKKHSVKKCYSTTSSDTLRHKNPGNLCETFQNDHTLDLASLIGMQQQKSRNVFSDEISTSSNQLKMLDFPNIRSTEKESIVPSNVSEQVSGCLNVPSTYTEISGCLVSSLSQTEPIVESSDTVEKLARTCFPSNGIQPAGTLAAISHIPEYQSATTPGESFVKSNGNGHGNEDIISETRLKLNGSLVENAKITTLNGESLSSEENVPSTSMTPKTNNNKAAWDCSKLTGDTNGDQSFENQPDRSSTDTCKTIVFDTSNIANIYNLNGSGKDQKNSLRLQMPKTEMDKRGDTSCIDTYSSDFRIAPVLRDEQSLDNDGQHEYSDLMQSLENAIRQTTLVCETSNPASSCISNDTVDSGIMNEFSSFGDISHLGGNQDTDNWTTPLNRINLVISDKDWELGDSRPNSNELLTSLYPIKTSIEVQPKSMVCSSDSADLDDLSYEKPPKLIPTKDIRVTLTPMSTGQIWTQNADISDVKKDVKCENITSSIRLISEKGTFQNATIPKACIPGCAPINDYKTAIFQSTSTTAVNMEQTVMESNYNKDHTGCVMESLSAIKSPCSTPGKDSHVNTDTGSPSVSNLNSPVLHLKEDIYNKSLNETTSPSFSLSKNDTNPLTEFTVSVKNIPSLPDVYNGTNKEEDDEPEDNIQTSGYQTIQNNETQPYATQEDNLDGSSSEQSMIVSIDRPLPRELLLHRLFLPPLKRHYFDYFRLFGRRPLYGTAMESSVLRGNANFLGLAHFHVMQDINLEEIDDEADGISRSRTIERATSAPCLRESIQEETEQDLSLVPVNPQNRILRRTLSNLEDYVSRGGFSRRSRKSLTSTQALYQVLCHILSKPEQPFH